MPYLVVGKTKTYNNQVCGSRKLIKFIERKILCMSGKTDIEELLRTYNHAAIKVIKVVR